MDAYGQALMKAGSRGVARARAMSVHEAEQILGLPKNAPLEELEKSFKAKFDANNPESGGSFYLQSKVFRAHEAISRYQKEKQDINSPS